METKQIIIYAIVAFAVYQLFVKEKFSFMRTDGDGSSGGTSGGLGTSGYTNKVLDQLGGTTSPSHIRTRQVCGYEGGPPCSHIHTRNVPNHIEGFSHNNQRGAMNFAHSSHVMNHIRSNRKNSMLNGMMYGNQIPCSGADCDGQPRD